MTIQKIEALRRKHEVKFERVLTGFFRKQAKKIKAVEADSNTELALKVNEIIDKMEKELRTILMSLWIDTVKEFGRLLYKEFGGKSFNFFAFGIYAYIVNKITQKVTKVNWFTKRIIRGVIEKGVKDGLSIPNITKLLVAKLTKMSKMRARRIARTEVCAASNYGSLQGAKQTGAVLKKFWISTYDKRTRKTHRRANNQTVGINEKFRIGKAWLMMPGDPDGPSEEIINCRCALGYKRVKE